MSNGKIYHPHPDEKQLTLRALVVGSLLGSVMSAINIYFGLQTGWTVGGSIIAAILAFSFFRYVCQQPDFGVLENNIVQTAGNAGSLISGGIGLVNVIPALELMGHTYPLATLYIWGLSVATLGIFYAIPLRRQFIEKEQMRFPTGIATAETIIALHHESEQDPRASILYRYALVASVLTLMTYFIPTLGNLHMLTWLGFATASAWGFSLFMSPMLIGAGMLVGVRIGCSLALGSLIAWGMLGPMAQHFQWVHGSIHNYQTGVQGWILWPGVSLMVCDSVMTFLLFMIKNARQPRHDHLLVASLTADPQRIPTTWWVLGLGVSSLLTIVSLYHYFDIPMYMSAIAIVLAWALAAISTRATGETDINPVSVMGKITQFVFAGVAPGQATINIMTAGVSAAGASSCADMMQDLKTGYMLGASPKKQFVAQLVGCLSGVIFAIPIYELFRRAYTIGGQTLPAPSAHAWRAMSELLTQGSAALPHYAWIAVIVAAGIGITLALLRVFTRATYLPSGVAMGVAFILPAYYSLDFFIGSMMLLGWQLTKPLQAKKFAFVVASGLLVGEGLMGIVKAILTLLGVPPLF